MSVSQLPSVAPESVATLAADDLPEARMTVRVLRSAAELPAHLAAWQRLAETAIEPNVFYEPTLALPALELLSTDVAIEFLVVEARPRKDPEGDPIWCGLFPLERRGTGPLKYRRLWKYEHCFLCTPLIRADVAEEVTRAFIDWMRREAPGLIKFDTVCGDGRWHQLLVEALRREGLAHWVSQRHCRALFRRAPDAETFLSALPRKRRHEFKRLGKRFAEQGTLEYRTLAPGDSLGDWLDMFLRLEAAGWKGRGGTALSCSLSDGQFFRLAAHAAHEQGRLMMSGLVFDGEPVALRCSFLTGDGGFAFKIAYDERFKQYSPGVLLEMHHIELLHARDDVRWIDSCAAPDHPMINHLWRERRTIETLWLAGGRRAACLLGLLPAARALAAGLRRH